jgi:hypothetical protein
MVLTFILKKVIPFQSNRVDLYFHYAFGFPAQQLAHMLDSLVRVSRRVGWVAEWTPRLNAIRITETVQTSVAEFCEQKTAFQSSTQSRYRAFG